MRHQRVTFNAEDITIRDRRAMTFLGKKCIESIDVTCSQARCANACLLASSGAHTVGLVRLKLRDAKGNI